jgi:hypothetical protein
MPKSLPIAALSIAILLPACNRAADRAVANEAQANTEVAKDVDSTLANTEAHGEGPSRPLTAPPPGNSR